VEFDWFPTNCFWKSFELKPFTFIKNIYTLTRNLTENNQLNYLEREPYSNSLQTQPKWKNVKTKPNLTVFCLLCEEKIIVKYNALKKQYSQKNNWNYWMKKKPSSQQKYLCNTCLWKLHVGKMSDWITDESRADVFYNYIKRGQFGKKDFKN